MKALRYIGVLLLTLLALFLILGLIAPKKAHLDRSISIQASPADVQNIVSKFSETKNWSPWAEYDSNMVVKLEGEDGAVGSKYSWTGNSSVGTGSQTLTKNEPGYVEQTLHFEGAMGGEAISRMKLQADSIGTKVTWSFDSESGYPWNAMNLFFKMDKFLGPDYEKGLTKLKAYVETHAMKKYRGYEVKEVDTPSKSYVGVRKTVAFQDIPKFFEESMGIVGAALKKANMEMSGPPVALYYKYDEQAGTADMVAAAQISSKVPVAGLTSVDIPAGKELCVDYFGAYEKTGEAHYAIDDYVKEKGLTYRYPVIEQFMNDPMVEKDTAKWLTKIIYPLIK